MEVSRFLLSSILCHKGVAIRYKTVVLWDFSRNTPTYICIKNAIICSPKCSPNENISFFQSKTVVVLTVVLNVVLTSNLGWCKGKNQDDQYACFASIQGLHLNTHKKTAITANKSHYSGLYIVFYVVYVT